MKMPPMKVAIPVGLLILLGIGYAVVRMDNAVATSAADKALEEKTGAGTPSATPAGDTP